MQKTVVATNDNIHMLVQDAIKKNGGNCDLNYIDASQVTDMSYLFFGSKFIGDISKWNVSNVTNMSQMFEMSQFNGDISQWDVSNVTDMSRMFANSQFNGDISRWNVSHVTNMYRMFADSQFNSDISDWDVSNVEDMSLMFEMSLFNGDISCWKTSRLKNMSRMFCGSKFTEDISNWDVSNVTDMSSLFCGAEFNGDISRWKVANVTDMSGLFWESKFTGDISDWVVSNVTTMRGMFFHSQFKGNISRWDVSKVNDMSEMFYLSKFTGDISQWVMSNVMDMSSMFRESQFNSDIGQWDVSHVTNMSSMFCDSKFMGDISQWVVSNVEDMSWMFGKSVFDGNLANWDVSNVKNMKGMFKDSEFNGNIDSWKVKKEADKHGMFYGCPLKNRIPIWYKFRDSKWLVKIYKEKGILESVMNDVLKSIRNAENAQTNASERKKIITVGMLEPYIEPYIEPCIKASIEDYCKKNDVDTNDLQIKGAAERLIHYLFERYSFRNKFSDRTVMQPIINHAIDSIRKAEKIQGEATEQKKNITAAMLVPYIKDSLVKYCQENDIKADNNQIQWTSNEIGGYYGRVYWLRNKFKDRTVLEPIIHRATASIRKAEKIQGEATEQKKNITAGMLMPYVKESIEKYCQENNVEVDDNQMQWASSLIVEYCGRTELLMKKINDKTVSEPIINRAIELLRKSESVELAVVGQMNDIAMDMVEPYVKESIEKYCQENNVKVDDNQMQWAADVFAKNYRNELFQKIQEKDARTKMKEMLTSDAEEDLS